MSWPMSWPVDFTIPIKTANPLNQSHGHWFVAAGKRKAQRRAALLRIPALKLAPVFKVTLTRVSSGELDQDGLLASLKAIVDAVAFRLGVDDRPRGLVTWVYAQETGKRGEPSVRVRIEVLPVMVVLD